MSLIKISIDNDRTAKNCAVVVNQFIIIFIETLLLITMMLLN